jgi:DNA-binding CsgD family transcriptional regulator
MSNRSQRIGDVQAMLRLLKPLSGATAAGGGDSVEKRRRLLADVCRMLGEHATGRPNIRRIDGESLSPRMEQTLQSLLRGDSEKQVAARLGLSQHTIHVYVKALYKKYGVSSRSELLAKWVAK